MRYLVTGGAGFIGSNLVEALLKKKGARVRILDNFATGKRGNLTGFGDRIELVEGDLRSYHVVIEAVRGADVIFHQGALPSVPRSIADPITTNEVNVGGTINILDAARTAGVKTIVFASSSSIYGGDQALPIKETGVPNPLSPYAVSKLAGEKYCLAYSRLYRMNIVCLRYFNVFGPRQDPNSQYSAVIPRFISFLQEHKRPTIFGDGEQTRDFTFVANVVRANLLAAEKARDFPGEVFNVAGGHGVSVNEMYRLLQNLLKRSQKPVYAPPRGGEVKHSMADIGKIQSLLGYKPVCDFKHGLKILVDAGN